MDLVPPLKILKASAGSGKTFALTVHFLSLLLENSYRYKEVLALTFTNKATAEMKSRILLVLERLARGGGDKSSQDYQRELQKAFPAWDETEIQKRADAAYRKILHDYGRFSVQTIDGFSQQVIRSFTYELGIDSGFQIELNLDKVRKDLIDQLYIQLNENQELFDWVLQRILQQISLDKSWDINRELFNLSKIIFSDDFRQLEDIAAREGNEKLFEYVPEFNNKWLELFDAGFKERILRIQAIIRDSGVTKDDLYGKSRNFIPKFSNYNGIEDDLDSLIKGADTLKDNIDAYQVEKSRTAMVDQLYYQLNPAILALLDYLNENKPVFHLIKAVDANIHYLRLLKDMTDLLAVWRSDNNTQLISDAQTLLSKIGRTAQGDPTFIWEKIGIRYQYFLFDEFQDTSHTQWDNLSPLLINAMGSGRKAIHEHLVVGDVKQSIYRWRNGDFRILLEGVEEAVSQAFHLKDPSEMVAKGTLLANYRSQKNIIDFNNYLYSNLPARVQHTINAQVESEIDEDRYAEHWLEKRFDSTILRAYEDAVQQSPPHLKADQGGVHVEFITPEESLTGRFSMTDFKKVACARTFDQIAQWIRNKKFKPGEIGVLVRTNDEARLLVDYFNFRLSSSDIVFPVVSGDALLLSGHPAVNAIISALRFMAYEGKTYHVFLADMVFYFSKATEKEILAEDWFNISKADIHSLSNLLPLDLIRNWDNIKQLQLTEQVERLIYSFGFHQEGTATYYLLAFRDLIAGFIESGAKGLQGFLDFWDEEGSTTALPISVESNAVEILTIHKSKGLAYEAVMIPFCTWSLDGRNTGQVWFDVEDTVFEAFERIPLQYSKNTKQSVLYPQYYQEQLYNYMDALNSLYVATTRAKEQLWILAPDPRGPKQDKAYSIRNVGSLLFDLIQEPFYIVESVEDFLDMTQKKKNDDKEALLVKGYPTSDILNQLLVKQVDQELKVYQKQRVSALFSVALHELMATVSHPDDLDDAVRKMILDGRLSPEEELQVIHLVRQAWGHPDLGKWLRGYNIQSNEQGIIDSTGATHIPDKVFFNAHETIVLDFKTTGVLSSPAHFNQVKAYTGFLQQMGFPSVKGYLYYFLQNELVEVY